MPETKLIQLRVKDTQETQALFGPKDAHLQRLEEYLQVSIVTRGEQVSVTGEEGKITLVEHVLSALIELIRNGVSLSERDVVYAVQLAEKDQLDELSEIYRENITTNIKGKAIRAKTLGQRHYVQTIKTRDLVFGIGPAGTGKTYLAVVMAVTALKDGLIKRIVLTRPAVEAGENLGFLPGDLKEKVDPYLRPLYDALHDVLGTEQTNRLMERGTIEVAPLAYMRGRTLDDAFVILDEAQNTTPEQMKMFLTRLGFGSKMVINGDLTQIDLPKGKQSGLKVAIGILERVKEIGFIYLQQADVVRHTLVQKILDAYEVEEKS
ncbi:PhoH family protein [Halalkalibacterium halodurans]|uniref:PhoH-like protein n=1 Tax=Halalkalibacterium halodurans (strain ATCC BAA-125 / DSM 18197 / FERM 7344 / JCM 9153 / C-125) TaxID=272558 RepID=Q9KD58_HALH5|nr:PhoH family protein [Halalkalibacterium halodurans]MDY7221886.1 PhoH family protein [Halalkalibacterium halodurans]MDY7241162.1 PhoH family protein [Halalkalibacterium halodurans]MED3648189.1 PhoH family protein [Halalkalibacterium halodurans]MED4080594.1 PhoH family protein [Halalkalibacterium halodurans]MED4083784.1 PhoH family protein [Halalkalibacterium halodurans]